MGCCASASVPPLPPRPEGGYWWEQPLPASGAVRKEARELSEPERERFKAAVLLMAKSGLKGHSQYFRCAVKHGGMRVLDYKMPGKYPEYCAHRRECFPNWHRPYLLDFESMLRLADIHLQSADGKSGGGDIGLPYWDWTRLEVNGEVMPAVAREIGKLLDNEVFSDRNFWIHPPQSMDFTLSEPNVASDEDLRALLTDKETGENKLYRPHSPDSPSPSPSPSPTPTPSPSPWHMHTHLSMQTRAHTHAPYTYVHTYRATLVNRIFWDSESYRQFASTNGPRGVCTCTHTCMHAYMHTYIHTYGLRGVRTHLTSAHHSTAQHTIAQHISAGGDMVGW